MGKNPNKDKGTRWEKESVELLNEDFPNTWLRVPTSGAIGTIINLPMLKGDIRGKYDFLPFEFIGEAKVGYGGKSMTIQKEWFDKVKEEAEESYGLPVVVLKFERSRTGVKHVIAMDFETWNHIMEVIEYLDEDLLKQYGRVGELEKSISGKTRGTREETDT